MSITDGARNTGAIIAVKSEYDAMMLYDSAL